MLWVVEGVGAIVFHEHLYIVNIMLNVEINMYIFKMDTINFRGFITNSSYIIQFQMVHILLKFNHAENVQIM